MNSLDMHVMPREIQLKNKSYQVIFDMNAFSHAEQAYAVEYGRMVNCGVIITEMMDGAISALTALAYGALRSGGAKFSYAQFVQEIFTYDQFNQVYDVVSAALLEAMGVDATAESKSEETEKN